MTQPFETKPKKRKRIGMWIFLAVQALFLVWIIVGVSTSGTPSDCQGLDAQTCKDASSVGTAIGVGLIIGLWAVVDFIMGITLLIIRLNRRDK